MTPSRSRHIIIIAGEASGDMHAAHLVEEIKKIDPQIVFSGLGGPRMRCAGVELYEDLTRLAVVGFVEVLRHLGLFRKIFRDILEKIIALRPEAVILVDYPGFNLRLAQALKKHGVKVIYYISPQVWAWKEARVKKIKECVDKMLVLFPFEKELYARHGLEVDWVGHPLVDGVRVTREKDSVLASAGFSPEKLTVGLLPGSRDNEVKNLLPPMMEAARILQKENPAVQFLLMRAPTISPELLKEFTAGFAGLPLTVYDENTYNGIHACDACMVASGTATLETAILLKPMVVVYKTSFLTWVLAKMLIKIPDIGLVNVVAGKRVVPECIQFQATGQHIAAAVRLVLREDKRNEIRMELMKVKESLGEPGAGRRAALKIIALISKK